MRRKTWALTILAGVLGALYLYALTDWLAPRHIQIIAQDRPGLSARFKKALSPIAFALNGKYRLTRIRVLPMTKPEANSRAGAMWELISSSNSVPVQGFIYGQRVRGMKPPPGAPAPIALVPGATYRLVVEAGHAKGEVDFRVPPASDGNTGQPG